MDKSDKISIHAPHEGERLNVSRDKAKNWRAFQSTLPARGSDYGMIYNLSFVINISIHAPREGERLYDVLRFRVAR